MPGTMPWILDSIKRNGLLQTLSFIKNTLHLRYVRDIKKQTHIQKHVNGLPMLLDITDRGISRTLAVKGEREKDQVYVVHKELDEGMTVLDIGANIGMYALLEASIVGTKGKVYALEPSPQNFELLQKNVALNGFEDTIDLHPVGASNQTGSATFYLHAASNLHTFHPHKYREFATAPDQYRDTSEVEVIHIGDFLKDKPPVDFIRMDIEGFEVEVFEGLTDILRSGRQKPAILFEVHRPKYDDVHHNMRARLQELFDMGYYAKTLISNDEAIARFREKGYEPDTVISTDGVKRGLYQGLSNEDAIAFICDIGSVRAALLSKS